MIGKSTEGKMKKGRLFLPDQVSLMWAYGSNLNVEAMRRRCPKAVKYKPLYVPKGQLVFRGVADVEGNEDARSVVAGGLWKVTKECIRALDAYEGISSGLYSKRYLILLVNGKRTPCLFYKMNSDGVMPPWMSYLAVIEQGYKDFGLELELLYAAVHRSQGEDRNKTPDLERRWIAKGKPKLARR